MDSHVKKHADISDDLILKLVNELDGVEQTPDDRKGTFEYFATFVELNKK
jgi:hypothetical protein